MFQKMVTATGTPTQAFLIPAFAFIVVLGTLFSFCLARFEKRNAADGALTERSKTDGKTWVYTILLGVSVGAVNVLNTYLSGKMPSAISFPVMNGGSILLTAVFSMLVFKERLTGKQKIGLILGFAAILMIACG